MKKLNVKEIADYLEVNNIVGRILKQRNIDTKEKIDYYINANLNDLSDPSLIPGIKEFKDRLTGSIYFGKIVIYSDYDVDGITSAYVLSKAIEEVQSDADYEVFISNRFKDGYGLSKRAVDIIASSGADLIVTLDCGIRAHEAIEYAESKGIDVIVLDHHDSNQELDVPYLDLKVNSGEYPFTTYCAAGLAWRFAQYLTGKKMSELLSAVAVATIADVVPLVGENRIIVKEGLKLFTSEKGNRGLLKIMEKNNVDPDNLKADDIAFGVAPLLNAVGRLGSAYPGYKLLKSDNEAVVHDLALELDDRNKRRQDLTADIMRDVVPKVKEEDDFIVVKAEAHEGLVGLIAGQLKTRFQKPTVVIDEKSGKGSARSVEPFNLFSSLEVCLEEGILEKAGGHEMAAGLNIELNRVDEFRQRINELLEGTDLNYNIYDLEIFLSEIDEEVVNDLNILEPCGKDNEKALFLTKNITPYDVYKISKGRHVKFRVGGFEAIAFFQGDQIELLKEGKVDIIYTLGFNEWNGRKNIQLIVERII